MAWRRPERVKVITGKIASTQSLRIMPSVLLHMSRHTQRHWWSREAGGQVFGHINDGTVDIEAVVGPNVSDERSRYTFRSDPEMAQRHINELHATGLHYLGEWHTHAQKLPSASFDDYAAIHAILRESQLSIDSLLLVIRGTAPLPEGVAVFRCSRDATEQLVLTYN